MPPSWVDQVPAESLPVRPVLREFRPAHGPHLVLCGLGPSAGRPLGPPQSQGPESREARREDDQDHQATNRRQRCDGPSAARKNAVSRSTSCFRFSAFRDECRSSGMGSTSRTAYPGRERGPRPGLAVWRKSDVLVDQAVDDEETCRGGCRPSAELRGPRVALGVLLRRAGPCCSSSVGRVVAVPVGDGGLLATRPRGGRRGPPGWGSGDVM